ncbi:hypothetical protein ALP32_02402 [Pseudomonas avellanae]|uniref:Uncharacterized protein n=1 Tax=Pseudomonas avellanae TaxID=46257 RepID=A0A3M5SZX6_9PSED|nr:hypothetical protein ALP32_02402 [Pseudomonas avellanae]
MMPEIVAPCLMISMLMTVFFSFYVAARYTEKLESLFPNSRFLEDNKATFSGAGFLGKIMRCGFMAFILMLPKPSIKRGTADARDIRQFPIKLKWILLTPWIAQLTLCTALILFKLWTSFSTHT